MRKFVKRATALCLSAVLAASVLPASATKDDTAYNRQLIEQEAAGEIYTSLNTGRWDDLTVTGYTGSHSVYVPDNYEYCSPGVIILTPDDVSASDWLDSDLGKKWIEVADTNAIALVVASGQDGKWNLDDDADGRDDEGYLYGIYGQLTSKSDSNPAAFDLNERALYLVGYEEGATAANEMAMMWPALFAGLTAVGGSAVPSAVAKQLGETISYPFAEASTAGREENNLPNNQIPVRVWEIQVGDSSLQSDISYWTAANDLTEGTSKESTNDYATVVSNTDANGDAEPEQVWYSQATSIDAVAPSTIYAEFLADVQRFVGDPGGYLEWTIEHTNDGTHGFFLTEEKVDGNTRRWYTYVPESYDGTQEYPLVVAMHGYSSAITAFTGDSRWQNVADKYGIIIAFAQAYTNDGAYSSSSCIPVPIWNNYSTVYCNTTKDDPDDTAFIKYLVDKTKADYKIDATRVYATGHSNGSAMTWMLAQDAPEYFTAVAPIGFNWGSYPGYTLAGGEVDYSGCASNTYLLPVWCMTGEYDVGEADDYSATTKNGKTISYWKAQNGTTNASEKTSEIRATRASHVYSTTTYSNKSGVPLVKFTQISNNCHSYMEDISFMVWEEFFSKYTRGADGTLYYEGTAVSKEDSNLSEAFTDITGHWGEDEIRTAVDENGLFKGMSSSQFSPDVTMDRGMLVKVLYCMDVNAQASQLDPLFSDVSSSDYYNLATIWASENGITKGTSGSTFSPKAAVTREQVATFLMRYAAYKGIDVSASADLSKYTDAGSVSEYATDAMKWAVGSGIIAGMTESTLSPQGSATRAQVATMLNRFLAKYGSGSETA